MTVRATVGAGGELRWLPEPVIAVRGCDHHMEVIVGLEAGAALAWREEVILGRHREAPGSVLTRTQVDCDDVPVFRHELALGPAYPGWASPAVTAGARAVGSLLLVGPMWVHHTAVLGPTAALLPLAGGGVQITVLADDGRALRRHLDSGMRAARANTAAVPAP